MNKHTIENGHHFASNHSNDVICLDVTRVSSSTDVNGADFLVEQKTFAGAVGTQLDKIIQGVASMFGGEHNSRAKRDSNPKPRRRLRHHSTGVIKGNVHYSSRNQLALTGSSEMICR